MGIYNCQQTLPAAIDSIIEQSYTNWQLIICDDASTDGSYALAEEYAVREPERIVLIRNNKNSKLSATLNHCLKYAHGEYIARMDADDISLPQRLEKQIAFLEEHAEYDMVGTAMIVFGLSREDLVRYTIEHPSKYSLVKGKSFFHATIMARRHVYERLNGYTVGTVTTRGQDFDLWTRFFAAGFHGYNLQEALYRVREDDAQMERKKFVYRLHAVKMVFRAVFLLKLPIQYYIFILRPLIAALIPKGILKRYKTNKLQNARSGENLTMNQDKNNYCHTIDQD